MFPLKQLKVAVVVSFLISLLSFEPSHFDHHKSESLFGQIHQVIRIRNSALAYEKIQTAVAAPGCQAIQFNPAQVTGTDKHFFENWFKLS